MHMKKALIMAAVLGFAGAAPRVLAQSTWSDEGRQALQMAVADAQKAVVGKLPVGEPISVLPIAGDQGDYVRGLLKNALTAAGLRTVEEKDEPFFTNVLAEVEWDERKADMLDDATIVKFGKLQATKILVYGTVREEPSPTRVFVELELHASSLVTKQHLWGGTFARRFYLPGARQGLVDLNDSIRQALKQAFVAGGASLTKSEKLRDVHTVLFVPLAGDVDGYITGLAKDMFKASAVNPKDLDVQTLGQARVILRDQPQQADATLVGSVRDLYREMSGVTFQGTNYTIHAEVQVEIQRAAGNEILWSDTLSAKATEFIVNPITPVDEAKIGLWNYLRAHPAVLLWIPGLLIALVVVRMFVKGATRVR
jgi:hypothetical protein